MIQNSIKSIEYQIDNTNLDANFIRITISFETHQTNPELKIAAWRPGRYMLQNYAANVRDWSARNENGNLLPVSKSGRNIWKIDAPAHSKITFSYLYYCRQMDAGGCWSDNKLFYINTIACLLAVDGQENMPCTLKLHLPESFKVQTGMPKESEYNYSVESFLALSDYPILASPDSTTLSYSVRDIPFYIHSTVDETHFPSGIVEDFKKFTEAQIADFGVFPEKEYHFLLLILPYQHYHGVEHRNSTVICLGPATDVKEKLYTELVGICSHELYHTWNICKIRPAEMRPYNLFQAQYFKTGFIAEGVTTYLGDYYLGLTNVFSSEWYQEELNILLKRHFYSFGNYHLSIADSSADLWVDGYDAGIPNRKVSIYVKGAIVAFLMDTAIRKSSGNASTLRNFMRTLWDSFQTTQEGYTEASIAKLFHAFTSNKYIADYERWIYGLGDLKNDLTEAFHYLRIPAQEEAHSNFFARHFGLLCDAHYTIQSVDPASPYVNQLGKGDKILRINNTPVSECIMEELEALHVLFIDCTNGIQTSKVELKCSTNLYFKTLQIQFAEEVEWLK